MAINIKDDALDEVKSTTVKTSSGQAGFIGQMAKLIADTAEETQYKPIKDVRDSMFSLLPTHFLSSLTEKTGEILKDSRLSFSNLISSLEAGDQAADKMESFSSELITANDEEFIISPQEDGGNYSHFDVDEETFINLSQNADAILAECIAFNEVAEENIRQAMNQNILYAPVLVFHKCRSAMVEHFLSGVCETLQKLKDKYVEVVDAIRQNRADVQSNLTLDELMGLAAYKGAMDMQQHAGSGCRKAGGDAGGSVPVPQSLDSVPLADNAPNVADEGVDMKSSDGELFDREGKLKYFMYNFIDGRALRTDGVSQQSALEEFTDWLSHAMKTGGVSCDDVAELMPLYQNQMAPCAEQYLPQAISPAEFISQVPSMHLPKEAAEQLSGSKDINSLLSEALLQTDAYCQKTQLDEAAKTFGVVHSFVKNFGIEEEDNAYNDLCDTFAQKLFDMIESEVTYGDYMDYKRLKGEVL